MRPIIRVSNLSKTYASGLHALKARTTEIDGVSYGASIVPLLVVTLLAFLVACAVVVGWIFRTGYRLKA